MKILTWYVIKIFFTGFFYCLAAMFALLLVANLIEKIESVFSSWQKLLEFFENFGRSIPTFLEIVLPITVLLATVITFTRLKRTSELVVMKTAGMGTGKIILTLVFFLIPISTLAYLNQNYLYNALLPEMSSAQNRREKNQWRASGKKIFYFRETNPQKDEVAGGRIFSWTKKPFRLYEIFTFSTARRTERGWRLRDITRRQEAGKNWTFERRPSVTMPGRSFPVVSTAFGPDAHHMPFFDLYLEIRQHNNPSPQLVLFQLEAYQKIAMLFVPFIMVFIGAPLSQFGSRSAGIGVELVIAILFGLAFWFGNETLLVFGKGGIIHPFLAAWGMNGVFLLLGLALLSRTK